MTRGPGRAVWNGLGDCTSHAACLKHQLPVGYNLRDFSARELYLEATSSNWQSGSGDDRSLMRLLGEEYQMMSGTVSVLQIFWKG